MRILLVVHTFPPESWGGTELHVLGLARQFEGEHEVRIFCRGGDPRLPHGKVTHGFHDGILVARFNNLYRDHDGFDWITRNRLAHSAFEAELDSFRPDLVHVHHFTSLSTTLAHACKARGLPLVLTLHDFWSVCPRGQRLHPREGICETIDRRKCHDCLSGIWENWFPPLSEGASSAPLEAFDAAVAEAVNLCDLVVAPSAFHRAKMLEQLEFPADRFVSLPHGLDHAMFNRLHDASRPVRVIGYIGSVVPPKGVHVLVEAFKALKGANLELRIHGDAPVFHERTDYLDSLREAAKGRRVRFMGHYDNGQVPALLEGVDILVVPSLWWETFSLTIREAMLAGVPVVASDLGAMHEALSHSRAGLLFPAGDAKSLARSLQRLIDDRPLRLSLANRRLEVKTLQRNALEYLEIYAQAREISMRRSESIVVNDPAFPDQKKAAAGGASAPEVPTDLRLAIEKVGGGEVRVDTDVERGPRTRVSFTFNYGPSSESSQVRLTLDFSRPNEAPAPRPVAAKAVEAPKIEAAKAAPAAPAAPAAAQPAAPQASNPAPAKPAARAAEAAPARSEDPRRGPKPEAPAREAESRPLDRPRKTSRIDATVVPRESELGTSDMIKRQSKEHLAAENEKAMYQLDSKIFREQVQKLDEMVSGTQLSEDERNMRPARGRGRGREERPEVPARAETPAPRRERDEGRTPAPAEAPRGGRRRDEAPGAEARDLPRSPRPAAGRDEGRERPAGREPARERMPAAEARPARRDEPQRARTPERRVEETRPAAAPRANPAPAAHPKEAEGVVWNAQPAEWGFPSEVSDPPKKAERSKNFRSGKQPTVTSQREDLGFGSGLDTPG